MEGESPPLPQAATTRFLRWLHQVVVRDNARGKSAVLTLYPQSVIDSSFAQQLPGLEKHYTPLTDHLHTTLREPLREFLPGDSDYTRCFDRFEYLFALAHSALTERRPSLGRFWWKYIDYPGDSIEREIELGATNAGEDWPPLQAGFFDGSLQKFQEEKKVFDNSLRSARRGRGWAMNAISTNHFKMLFPDLAEIHIKDIRQAMQARNVSEALEIFDVAAGHFGIETIRGDWVDAYLEWLALIERSARNREPFLAHNHWF
jgi:hypothetical protein